MTADHNDFLDAAENDNEITLADLAHDEDLDEELEECDCPHCYDEADPGGMDGDHESALASAGWGTDEDYGYFGGDDDGFYD